MAPFSPRVVYRGHEVASRPRFRLGAQRTLALRMTDGMAVRQPPRPNAILWSRHGRQPGRPPGPTAGPQGRPVKPTPSSPRQQLLCCAGWLQQQRGWWLNFVFAKRLQSVSLGVGWGLYLGAPPEQETPTLAKKTAPKPATGMYETEKLQFLRVWGRQAPELGKEAGLLTALAPLCRSETGFVTVDQVFGEQCSWQPRHTPSHTFTTSYLAGRGTENYASFKKAEQRACPVMKVKIQLTV